MKRKIRPCTTRDMNDMFAIINDAARAYKGVIPHDRWCEPYMTMAALRHEIADGVRFWGYCENGRLIGIMGIQDVQDVTLIRHAYVYTAHRNKGIGTQLLRHLKKRTKRPVLIGTWRAAVWAIAFYEKHGFRRVTEEVKRRLLPTYWSIPKRQIDTSVVLADTRWFRRERTFDRCVSVILAHPHRNSLNHAFAATVREALIRQGYRVFFHDLYAERFDPVVRFGELSANVLPRLVARHCQELRRAAGIVIIHPNWWGQPPAILKGWVDRVLRAGVAYRFAEGDAGEGIPFGLLRARQAVIVNTTDTPPAREKKLFGDPLATLWGKCMLPYCGVNNVSRKTYGIVVTSSAAQRNAWLADAARVVKKAFPKIPQ